MPNSPDFLARLPAIIASASKALGGALKRQMMELFEWIVRAARSVATAVARLVRRLWRAYISLETRLLEVFADGVLTLVALRLFFLLLLIAVTLIYTKSWLGLACYLVFLLFSIVRFFRVERADVDREVQHSIRLRTTFVRLLRWLVRLSLPAASLFWALTDVNFSLLPSTLLRAAQQLSDLATKRGGNSSAIVLLGQDWVLRRNGEPVSPPLLYADRMTPRKGYVSQPSPSGRYVFVDLCDEDWCDDQRLVDMDEGRIWSHIDSASSNYVILGMKEGGGSARSVTRASWSPTERFVIFGEYVIDLVNQRGSLVESLPFNDEEGWDLSLLGAHWISDHTFQVKLSGREYTVDASSLAIISVEPN